MSYLLIYQITTPSETKTAIEGFFTVGTLTSLSVATLAVYTVCGAVQQAFDYSPKWLALAVSISISYIAVYFTDNDGTGKYVVAFFNGCLIYTTATGANTLAAPKPTISNGQEEIDLERIQKQAPQDGTVLSKTKKKFRTSWWL